MKTFIGAGVAIACALSTTAFAQALPTQKVLTAAIAQTLVQEAVAKCRADGFKITVRVVDHNNNLRAFLRDDGASMITPGVAEMKAYTAVATGRPSGPPANLPAGAPVPPPAIPGFTNFEGGIPIKAGDQVIGAISVSGAPGGDKDAACANAGLAKVANQLK